MHLHFRTYGQGEPLIILHGLLGSLDNWHSISQRLSSHFQVHALDQRNHGQSPHAEEMSYPLLAEDVNEFIQAQDLERAHVLGHSMGGKTAMQLALLHPERVKKLIAVDLAPRRYPPRHKKIFAALLALDLPALQTRKQVEDALAPEIPDLATRQFLLKNVARAANGTFHWKNGLHEIHANYPRLGEAVTGAQSFGKPVLFIRGEQSDYLLEEDLAGIRALFPRAELRTIPNAGHLPHTENPDEFLRTVMQFLTEREL